jgi:hypothetical protein
VATFIIGPDGKIARAFKKVVRHDYCLMLGLEDVEASR